MDRRPVRGLPALARLGPGLGILMCLAGCAPIGGSEPSRPEDSQPLRPVSIPITQSRPGFLTSSTLDDLALRQHAASGPTAADVAADRAVWLREGQTPGTDRWYLAIRHAELRSVFAPQHFDCALGTRLATVHTPALTQLFAGLNSDVAALWLRVRAERPRPIDLGTGRAACIRLRAGDTGTGGSPSAGAALAAVWAEAMADLAPDRADQTRRIGREIGHSLSICGLAWPQDVAAGERLGQAVWQAARTDPAYQALADAARAELAIARADPLESPACAAERLALGL